MSSFQRQRSRRFALWLALAALALRVLLPQGFMLERGPGAPGFGLAICYASPLAKLRADQGAPAGAHDHADCVFAAACGPAMPAAAPAAAWLAATPQVAAGRIAVSNDGLAPRLQPPARAPPLFS